MTSYTIGQKVELNDGRIARIQFIGTTAFQTGEWIGVELDEPTGKNDGSVKGDRYFECEQGYGMFVRSTGVRKVVEDLPKQQKRTSVVNGVSAGVKARPSSVHAAVNGVRKSEVLSRRTSTIAASPTPGARSGLTGIRSPTKSPIKQLGTNPSSTSTSRTSTPSTTSARRPAGAITTTSKPRPSVVGTARTTSSTARLRPSIAPARASQTNGVRSTTARPFTIRPAIKNDDDQHLPQDAAEQSTADGPIDFAPSVPPPVPPDEPLKASTRRGSSPAASIHSQRTTRGSAVSSRHVEELEAKIRLLERKRLEDRDVRRSMEQAQQERDKYQGIIEKLQKKYQPQQQEIADLKKALADADSKRSTIEDLQTEHDSIMEMALLDKEMAEETAEALKSELDQLRSHQEEMELELEVLREENAEFSKDMSAEERTSAGWLQLEKENDRLRNALLRLRDLTQDREEELKSDLAELQTQVKEYESISTQLDNTKEKLLASESLADELRQQLEAALGAEEMIEELTDRNMGLTERIDELRVTIEDLENLKELNDELEINHIEAEKQMQEEIDFKDALVLDRDRIAKQQQSALDDADYTINRFRELVTQLQNDLQDMQASKQISETEASDLESKSRAMIDLNMRLQTSAAKTQVKTIDLELRKMEAEEASEHLAIVQLFLPDSYSSDRDSVLALLRFKRIKFKATMLQTFVRERLSSFGARGQDENIFALADFHNCLTWIAGTAERFIKAICMCSVEDFAKYESAQYELEPVERALNTSIEALRRDSLRDEAQELQRSVGVMEHLASIHIGVGLASHSDQLISRIVYLQSQLEGIASSFTGMKVLIEHAVKSEDEDSSAEYITSRTDTLTAQTRNIKVILGKTQRALIELQERSLTLGQDCNGELEATEQLSNTISNYTRTVGEAVRDLCNEEGREAVTVDDIASVIIDKAATTFDIPAQEAGPFTTVLSQLRALSDAASELAALTNDLDNTVEFERAPAPWLAKSEQLQQHKLTAQDTEAELARTLENLREREITIRSKDAELDQQSVEIEMLQARMREAGKRSARIVELERVVLESKEVERKSKQELDKAQRDAAQELERVKAELSRAAQRSRNGTTNDVADNIGPGTQLAMKRQEHQIVTLQSAVRYLKEENTRLRVPATAAPRVASQSVAWLYEPLLKPRQDARADLQQTGKDLLQTLREIVLSPHNINLTALPENKLAWRPAKKTSRWQLEKNKEEWAIWQGLKREFIHDATTSRVRSKLVT